MMILVNGVETGVVDATDRGIAYGDGVFRTFAARDGQPEHWVRHAAKLAADCSAIGLRCPDKVLLEHDIARVCRAQPFSVLKILVTRGPAVRGYSYASQNVATRIVLSSPLPTYPQTYAKAGVRVRVCALRLGAQPALAGVKHLNRLENVLARAEWSDPHTAEGILRDTAGNIISGTMTNVFVVKGEKLITPTLVECGVAGVTRQRVLEAAARNGGECEVRRLSLDEVVAANEIFLTNSLAGVWPVRELEGQGYTPGALTRAVQDWLKDDDAPS
jgi:4-amino-4-deoxychorismate lyase